MKHKLVPALFLMIAGAGLSFQSWEAPSDQETWVVPDQYVKMKNPFASDPDDDRIGLELYSQYCSSCHGKKGKGDGPNAGLIDVPVADFTSEAVKKQTDGSMYYKIMKGRGIMPGFEGLISVEEDRWLLVNYLKRL